MRAFAASLVILVSFILLSSCGDSATEITGTLPVVTGIAIDSIASRGDTIVVTWDELTTEIEGYLVWFRSIPTDPWMLVDAVIGNAAVHIADRSAYYTVMAYYGDDTSMDIGLSDNTMTDELAEYAQPSGDKPRGFRIDIEADSIIAGDPADPDFHQQFTVAFSGPSLNKFLYPGTAHQEIWPGGVRTTVSSAGGFVAPAPGDSILWQDSIPFDGDFFLALETGHYCKLDGLLIFADTLGSSDTMKLDGQIQPLMNVRVFRQTW